MIDTAKINHGPSAITYLAIKWHPAQAKTAAAFDPDKGKFRGVITLPLGHGEPEHLPVITTGPDHDTAAAAVEAANKIIVEICAMTEEEIGKQP